MTTKLSIFAVALVALPISSQAADIHDSSLTQRFGPSDPVYDWSGYYIGANVGYHWADSFAFELLNIPRDGLVGGGQIGFNKQHGSWVFGAEADFQFADSFGIVSAGGDIASTDLRWYGSVRGRFGYAFDDLLVYATSGWAYGNVRDFCNDCGPIDIDNTQTLTAGWIGGAGLEWGMSPNWTARV